MPSSRAVLQQKVAKILKGADLTKLTAKKVRQQLEDELGEDLTARKKEIDEMVMQLITNASTKDSGDRANASSGEGESADTASEQSDSDSNPPAIRSVPAKNAKSVPEATSAAAQREPPAKKQKTTKHVEKPDSVQRSSSCEDDEALARQLQEEEATNTRSSRHRAAKSVKSNRSKDGKPKRERVQGQSVYSKPCLLSHELAAVMGTDQMARKDVVKTLWTIIKERNLQDPNNKQYMICDDQLFPIFKVKRVKAFGMMKYLADHMTDQR